MYQEEISREPIGEWDVSFLAGKRVCGKGAYIVKYQGTHCIYTDDVSCSMIYTHIL